ncbi:hypothetical protein BH18ACT4_BH18ACT4_11880 [soil metagenome]
MTAVFGHGRLRLYLLKLLDEGPRHGYEFIRLLEDRFLGLYAPSAGTVYPRLARLEEEGLIEHDERDGRKVYRLTELGRAELRRRADDVADLESEIAGSVRDLAREVRDGVHASVRDLRDELRSAARDNRRQDRHRTRVRGAGTDVGAAVDRFRAEIRRGAMTVDVDDATAARVRDVLDDALAQVLAALRGHGPR